MTVSRAKPAKKRKGPTPMKKADALFSKLVRSRGRCEGNGFTTFPCSGQLQCAHLISRRYKATRWLEGNAACLCKAHHVYWTHNPLEWDEWCGIQLGAIEWDELKRIAREGGKTDYPEVLARLKARADELGIAA